MSCAGLFIGVAMMSIYEHQSFSICRVHFEKGRFVKILFLNVLRWPVHWCGHDEHQSVVPNLPGFFLEKRRFVKILFLNVLRWPVHWWPL